MEDNGEKDAGLVTDEVVEELVGGGGELLKVQEKSDGELDQVMLVAGTGGGCG